MHKVFLSLLILILSLFSLGTVFASEIPFTDIEKSDPYYQPVKELYNGGILSDNGDHLYRPKDLMGRDFFVSLVVGIGCHKCETPRLEDIIRYKVSPFVDLPKTNAYFYCIAYAKEYDIAQGYILDLAGNVSCEDKKQYTSSPFCAANTITRIEAAAILLRRAKLWDDTLNRGNFEKNITIPDASSYWYGYAKKALQIDLIQQKGDGTIGQDDKITRGEFAIMAAKILRYTQCVGTERKNSVYLELVIKDPVNIVKETEFFPKSPHILATITASGAWDKRWTLTNPITKTVHTGPGDTYPIKDLDCGTWIALVELIERQTGNVVSSAWSTIYIKCSDPRPYPLSVNIEANPLSVQIGKAIDFTPTVAGGSGTIVYNWDFGDSIHSPIPQRVSHTYTATGTYTVTLTVTDRIGNTAQSSIVVQVYTNPDTDDDTLPDPRDDCPLVYALTPNGCPIVVVYKPGEPPSNQPTAHAIEAKIGVLNSSGVLIKKTRFPKAEIFSLIPITGSGTWNYSWHATHLENKKIVTKDGYSLPRSMLDIGDWYVILDVIDPKTKEILASPSITISIYDEAIKNDEPIPCVMLDADPLRTLVGSSVLFTPTVCPSPNPLIYTWDYGDNSTASFSGKTNHIYTASGFYPVTLTITDEKTKKTGRAKVIIAVINPNLYTPPSLITDNVCLEKYRKKQGLLIGTSNCIQCPCSNSINIDASLRSCDIVFPTILSPTLDTVYSRGGFYLIP